MFKIRFDSKGRRWEEIHQSEQEVNSRIDELRADDNRVVYSIRELFSVQEAGFPILVRNEGGRWLSPYAEALPKKDLGSVEWDQDSRQEVNISPEWTVINYGGPRAGYRIALKTHLTTEEWCEWERRWKSSEHETTKSGLTALWEEGGGKSNTGKARVICDEKGQPKKAVYVKRRGELSCGQHALIPVEHGDVVIVADHHHGDFNLTVSAVKVDTLPPAPCCGECIHEDAVADSGTQRVRLIPILCYERGEWEKVMRWATLYKEGIPNSQGTLVDGHDYRPAVEAAKEKATCYHCREPHYIRV
jgi:hypothetical protein